MKRSTMVKLIEMQIKSDGLIQRSPVQSTEEFASRVLHAVMKAGMRPASHTKYKKDAWGVDVIDCESSEFEAE